MMLLARTRILLSAEVYLNTSITVLLYGARHQISKKMHGASSPISIKASKLFFRRKLRMKVIPCPNHLSIRNTAHASVETFITELNRRFRSSFNLCLFPRRSRQYWLGSTLFLGIGGVDFVVLVFSCRLRVKRPLIPRAAVTPGSCPPAGMLRRVGAARDTKCGSLGAGSTSWNSS